VIPGSNNTTLPLPQHEVPGGSSDTSTSLSLLAHPQTTLLAASHMHMLTKPMQLVYALPVKTTPTHTGGGARTQGARACGASALPVQLDRRCAVHRLSDYAARDKQLVR